MRTMNITYDPIADAMYIYLLRGKKITRTEEVRSNLLIDFAGKEMAGIEILNASKLLPKKGLDSITLTLPTYRGKVLTG